LKRRTIKEAVIEALKRAGKPLSVKDIYNLIIEHDLYRFNAEDPVNIVKVEIRRHCEGVDFPSAKPNKYFQVLRDGRYWINDVSIPGADAEAIKVEKEIRKASESLKTIVEDLKTIQKKHFAEFKNQVINQLKQIEPKQFETFSKRLLDVYGFENVKVTRYFKDGGIDGYGKLKIGLTYLNVAFQCKRWKSNVSRVEIDKFRGAAQGDFEYGIMFTTAKFSKDAQDVTIKRGAIPVVLIDGETLVNIMIEKRFGVDIETMEIYINALDRALTEES
jgi:restriction system protein